MPFTSPLSALEMNLSTVDVGPLPPKREQPARENNAARVKILFLMFSLQPDSNVRDCLQTFDACKPIDIASFSFRKQALKIFGQGGRDPHELKVLFRVLASAHA